MSQASRRPPRVPQLSRGWSSESAVALSMGSPGRQAERRDLSSILGFWPVPALPQDRELWGTLATRNHLKQPWRLSEEWLFRGLSSTMIDHLL